MTKSNLWIWVFAMLLMRPSMVSASLYGWGYADQPFDVATSTIILATFRLGDKAEVRIIQNGQTTVFTNLPTDASGSGSVEDPLLTSPSASQRVNMTPCQRRRQIGGRKSLFAISRPIPRDLFLPKLQNLKKISIRRTRN
jgi:hypothetical protein